MNTARRFSCFVLAIACVFPCAVSADPHLFDQRRLFSIRSNYNKNEVVYEALLDGGRLDRGRPVRVHWILHEDHDRLEGLSVLEERLAFGIEVDSVTDEVAHLHFKVAKQRLITVRWDGDQLRAYMLLNGEECALTSIYGVVTKYQLIPSVKYVELLGISSRTGKPVTERVQP
ncbi:MAG: DUF4833 domain-containing protein [Deltaproteobacteria bacterium]|nr:DUF4833 domain-containing protein [Deltaproteobacteria bacterium]